MITYPGTKTDSVALANRLQQQTGSDFHAGVDGLRPTRTNTDQRRRPRSMEQAEENDISGAHSCGTLHCSSAALRRPSRKRLNTPRTGSKLTFNQQVRPTGGTAQAITCGAGESRTSNALLHTNGSDLTRDNVVLELNQKVRR